MSFFKKWLTEYRPKPTLFCFLFFTDTTASRPLVRLTVVRLLSVTVASDCCPLRWVAPVPSHRTKTGFCETPPPPPPPPAPPPPPRLLAPVLLGTRVHLGTSHRRLSTPAARPEDSSVWEPQERVTGGGEPCGLRGSELW